MEEVAKSRDDVILEILDMSSPENLTSALILQIASTPSICIDDDVVAIGDVPSVDELNRLIDERKSRLRAK